MSRHVHNRYTYVEKNKISYRNLLRNVDNHRRRFRRRIGKHFVPGAQVQHENRQNQVRTIEGHHHSHASVGGGIPGSPLRHATCRQFEVYATCYSIDVEINTTG